MTNPGVVIVTGANVGIGLEVAKQLCNRGWEVVMACRSEDKASSAIDGIKQDHPHARVMFMQLDLADLSSVRAFASAFKKSGKALNILINNAGVYMSERKLTKDGFEMTVGTNHLGHFLLTILLLDDIKRAAADTGEARIINVSSAIQEDMKVGPKFKPLDFDDLMYSKKGSFSSGQAYRDSKLMNVLFTNELARRLAGTNVFVNSIHPGAVPETSIFRNLSACLKCMLSCLTPCLMCCCGARTSEQSAAMLCDLATSDKYKGVTGAYFRDGKEATPSQEALQEDIQERLWSVSADLVQLQPSDNPSHSSEDPLLSQNSY